MNIFDKAQWHIDAGMDEKEIVDKFNVIFKFLNQNDMLSIDGKEILDVGIDSSVSLNENMVNEKGYLFLDVCYDSVINNDANDIKEALNKKLLDIKKIAKLF